MKIVTPRLRSLLFSAAVFALLPLGAMAETSISVFSPKEGLADGWKSTAWSGPVVNEVEGFAKGTTTLQVDLTGAAQPYAGVAISANQGSGIELTDKLRQTGVVIVSFMPGKNAQGDVATIPQSLQLALSFQADDGQTVHATFNTQAIVTTSEAGTKVSITLPNAIKGVKAPEQLASISAVRIQFVGAPISGFYIVNCFVKSE